MSPPAHQPSWNLVVAVVALISVVADGTQNGDAPITGSTAELSANPSPYHCYRHYRTGTFDGQTPRGDTDNLGGSFKTHLCGKGA